MVIQGPDTTNVVLGPCCFEAQRAQFESARIVSKDVKVLDSRRGYSASRSARSWVVAVLGYVLRQETRL